jgi:hypothetical protein
MLRDSRHIAEAYTTVPSTPISVPNTITPGVKMTPTPVSQGNEETKKTVKDWLRLEPGLYPIDTVRKADHTAHVMLQFIYSICAGPDAVNRVLKTLNKAYKQDKK